jgi:phage gp46-like protein
MIELELANLEDGYDLIIDDNGDLKTQETFDTFLIYSLFGERRALESESPITENRRGWMGNIDGYENGSKLWLFEQERLTRTTLNNIKKEAHSCLQWLVDEGLLKEIKTNAEIISQRVVLRIDLIRLNSVTEQKYFIMWHNTGK